METQTLTLTEFLLARIAEDERRAFDAEPGWATRQIEADCEAKRRIIEELGQPRLRDATWMRIGWGDWLLGTLAAVYSDHPDYRDEWAV